MNASHLCGQGSSLASGAPQSHKHPHPVPPQPYLAHSQRSTNITYCTITIITICMSPSGKRRRGKGQLEGAEGRRRARLPMQMPVAALGSALRSQERPRLSSQGCSSEQLSPRWRAHTRQQEQSSSTALTPGAQVGGVLGQRTGHWAGQRWVAATWCGRDAGGESSQQGRPEGRATRAPGSGHPAGRSSQTHLRGAPLTCPRTWRSRKARQRHRFDRLCTLCMIRLFPPALTKRRSAPQIGPAGRACRSGARLCSPAAPRRFYSALPGRAQAGWLRGRREEEGGICGVGNGTNPGVAMAIGRACSSP